jgi:WD40 repeat protein
LKNNSFIAYFILLAFLSCALVAKSQTEPRLVLPIGHTDFVNSAVFSPDGKLALTASKDKTARIYDVATGKEIHCLTGHTEEVKFGVFSPNGKLVITASDDKTTRLYDVSSGEFLKVLSNLNCFIGSVVFSPDEKLVLIKSCSTVSIFEIDTGRQLEFLSFPIEGIHSATFSQDGKLVETLNYSGEIRIYEISTGKEAVPLNCHSHILNSAIFSPDGKLILIESDSSTFIYDVSAGKDRSLIRGFSKRIECASFSSKGEFALIASRDTALIYNVKTREELKIITPDARDKIYRVAFSSDEKLALVSFISSTRIYEVSTGKELQLLSGHTRLISSAMFSPDGKLVLTASLDNTARIFSIDTGKIVHVLSGDTKEITSFEFSSDGKKIITTSEDHVATICEIGTGKGLGLIEHNDRIISNEFSPDGSLALTASWDGTAFIFDALNGKVFRKLSDNNNSIISASFSPNGKFIITHNVDGNNYIFEVSTDIKGPNLFSENTGTFCSAVFSSNSKWVLISDLISNAVLYEVSTGKVVYDFGEQLLVDVVKFSLDGHLLLISSQGGNAGDFDFIFDLPSRSMLHEFPKRKPFSPSFQKLTDIDSLGKFALLVSNDGTARMYDLGTRSDTYTLSDPNHNIDFANFSPNGQLILTRSSDGSSRIWDRASGKELFTLSAKTEQEILIKFSPDGKFIITTSADHKTILWETATGKPLYTRLQLKDNDWLVYDEHYRFDGTPGAIEKLYFTCGLEVIDLAQMKDSLWVPGLVEKIMSGQDILINDKLAPKLSNLNICDLTPVIEPLEQEDKKILKYRITPRNGGLGNTEVYINGNLTYSLSPKQLKKTNEDGKVVYYLTLSTDTLQQYLTGKKNDKNPILVKSKVKGSGIYSRGEELEIAKTNEEEKPQFYGVFIGVNEYGNSQNTTSETNYRNLVYAAKDANDLSLAVEKTAANLFKSDAHIYRLTGTGNEAPTKRNLQRVLAEIGEKSKASDILYIFFAGHGDILRLKDTTDMLVTEQDQIRFMLMNAEKKNPISSSFGVKELTKWCSPQKIKAQKRVFVFDACHSGKIIDQTMAFNGRGDDEGSRIRQLDKLKDKNGMMILAAAADDESAYEDETLNQGVLTYHLLQVMKEQSDTSLVVRNWFDETIELVKDYSKANGNKQEPSSFGDGRFEIGNVNQDVRESIQITCPKTRVGACVFVDPTGEAEILYPGIREKINKQFSGNSRSDLVFSSNTDKAFRATGTYFLNEGKLLIRYKLIQGSQQVGEAISLPLKSYGNEDDVVQSITNSIVQEIEKLRIQDEKCKFDNN